MLIICGGLRECSIAGFQEGGIVARDEYAGAGVGAFRDHFIERGVMAIVDYAHAGCVGERVIDDRGAEERGTVITVVGAGGDQDRTETAGNGGGCLSVE